jgi:hypothetical protein
MRRRPQLEYSSFYLEITFEGSHNYVHVIHIGLEKGRGKEGVGGGVGLRKNDVTGV